MDLSKYNLTFLLNKDEAIAIKNAVIDELEQWEWMLDDESINRYMLLIKQLSAIISNLSN